ncbi:hypothetical protein MnTg02_03130 [bacterium MnTg02]|nr:hypothetical protein MnTg02_03130 [bacterium MnTg02]
MDDGLAHPAVAERSDALLIKLKGDDARAGDGDQTDLGILAETRQVSGRHGGYKINIAGQQRRDAGRPFLDRRQDDLRDVARRRLVPIARRPLKGDPHPLLARCDDVGTCAGDVSRCE